MESKNRIAARNQAANSSARPTETTQESATGDEMIPGGNDSALSAEGPARLQPCKLSRHAKGEAIETMTIEEKLREIMLSEEMRDSEKLNRLHTLIPLESFKIDNLNHATPAQLKQLKDGLLVTEAMQQLRRRTAAKE